MRSLKGWTPGLRVAVVNGLKGRAAGRRGGALAATAMLVCVAGGGMAWGQAPAPGDAGASSRARPGVSSGVSSGPAGVAGAAPTGPVRIKLDVVARDRQGAGVAGLTQDDFVLMEDGRARAIDGFEAVVAPGAKGEPPVQVILLVDAVNTNFTTVAFERDQISKFLRGKGGELQQPTSLVLVTDTSVQTMGAATVDGEVLAGQLEQTEIALRSLRRSAGFYGAVERFQISVGALERVVAEEKGRPGRKLLVWLSPGWPLLSGPQVDLTAKEEDGLFRTIVGVSTALREARVTMYSIDPLGTADAGTLRTSYYKQFLKGAATAKRVDIGDLGLQVLAVQSGGRALSSNNDLAALIEQCYGDARAYYELSFRPSPAEHADEYRTLEVRSERPGLAMQTRTGYYAQP